MEKFTDKQIKQAFGIINDPRWKGGDMTHIVKTIEKIAKGLSKHPSVQKALKVTNETQSEFMKFAFGKENLEEGKKLRNVLTDKEMEKSMKKALADKANWKGGKVNWPFIDADMYMELTAKGYDLRHPSINYMDRFDKLADKLDPEMNEARHDAPKGSRNTSDDNPLITIYDDEFKAGRPGISGHMNLQTWMNIVGVSKKFQKELAKMVVKGGVGKKLAVPQKAIADNQKEYEEEDKRPRNYWIELSQHHEKEMNEGVEYVFEMKMKNKSAKELWDYSVKSGGIDKKDFQMAAGYLEQFHQSGNKGAIANLKGMMSTMDTDPRDKIADVIWNNDKALYKALGLKRI